MKKQDIRACRFSYLKVIDEAIKREDWFSGFSKCYFFEYWVQKKYLFTPWSSSPSGLEHK